MLVNFNISKLFEELLQDLECQEDTKNYIIGIFGKYKNADYDLSQHSITLIFAQARQNHNFLTYQNLGDFLFFAKSIFPNSLHHASEDYYDTVARLSYYSCYRLINKQWKLFEELADNFIILNNQARIYLSNKLYI